MPARGECSFRTFAMGPPKDLPVADTQSYPAEEAAPETRPITLGAAIRRRAEAHPDRPALVASGYAPLTYSALQGQLDEARRQLRGAGLGCSARVGVVLPNGPEAVLTIVAVACCAVAVPIDPRLTPAELEQRLRILGLDAIVVPLAAAAEAREAAQSLKIATIDAVPCAGGRLALRLALPVSGMAHDLDEPDPDAPAFILQTSGTTAQPKLIPFSHRNMLAAAARVQAWFGLTPQDRCLSVSPPYYSHGLKLTVFTPLLTGGSIALPANAAVVDPFEWFDALRPTWYSASPAVHRALIEKIEPGADEPAMHTLRFIVSAVRRSRERCRTGCEPPSAFQSWSITAPAKQRKWPPICQRRAGTSPVHAGCRKPAQ